MPAKERLTRLMQLWVKDPSKSYEAHILDCIEIAWARFADSAEWWFLRRTSPISLNLQPSVATYEIDATTVGKIISITNTEGRPLWTYLPRKKFDETLRAGLPRETGSYPADEPSIFTVIGRDQDKIKIRIFAASAVAQTVYVQCQEAGTLDNLDKLPLAGDVALLHLAKSLVAPPETVVLNNIRGGWETISTTEAALANQEMIRFQNSQQYLTPEYLPAEPEFDPSIEERLEDINE